MKRICKKSATIRVKLGRNSIKTINLVEGKPVVESKLKEMSARQIEEYTVEVEELDLSFLTPEDKKFYNKNKKDPDMQWALDILHGWSTNQF